MQLTLTRQFVVEDATIGTLLVDGAFQCFTLEDVERAAKIKSKTAIPTGTYDIALTESPRFSDSYEEKGLGRIVPLLLNVPNYVGVRIHVGNTAAHTDGCILVGTWSREKGASISDSRTAFKALMKVLNGAPKGSIRIKIDSEVAGDMDGRLKTPSLPLFQGMLNAWRGIPA